MCGCSVGWCRLELLQNGARLLLGSVQLGSLLYACRWKRNTSYWKYHLLRCCSNLKQNSLLGHGLSFFISVLLYSAVTKKLDLFHEMQTLDRVRIRTEVNLLLKKLISSEIFQLPTVLKFPNKYFFAFLLLKNLLYHL